MTNKVTNRNIQFFKHSLDLICSSIYTCQNVHRTFVTHEAERMSDVDVVEVEDCNSSETTGPSEVGGCSQGVKVVTFHQWRYSH